MKSMNERKIEEKKQKVIFEAREKNENVKRQRERREAKIEEFKNWKKDVIKKEIEEKTKYEDRAKQMKIK